jgi:hypothetical protein
LVPAREVQERRSDGGGGPAKAAGNVDEGGQGTADAARPAVGTTRACPC